ncbi:hypothetical protein L1987_50280 [Smallanthus sonchifolius]|uniref:Uncharacterized protein n=1 Tax=Smallanthus sonchifolius TaxID=185202 RepID=A0ACB9EME3_9ASTR|nr:hypothetical protein L1987_50280 [Smallanthus sonchifolius]
MCVLFNLKNLESLDLSENNFNFSKIPSRFGSFAGLKYLNLSNSVFSGQIPVELSQLTRLETIDLSSVFSFGRRSLRLENPNLAILVQNLTKSLSNCELSGPLDDSLQKLQSLSVIHLALNNLRAPVPDFFENFKNLTVMNLGSCNLLGTFPNKILQLQKLQILDLALNKNLYGSLPDFPINGSLTSLVVSFTKFSGGIPESIGNLKNLSRIELFNSNFMGQLPKSIQNLTQLGLSGIIPSAHFQDLENLVSVDLRFNGFIGSIPSSLFTLQKLQQIQLSNNNFEGLLPNFTNSSLSSLDTLDLSSNKLEGEIPRSIFELRNLNILLLSSNNLSGTIRTIDFQDRLSNLSTLDLSFNNLSITTSNNITLVNHLPKFTTLKLASCNLTNFPNLRNQSRLINLDLSNNKIEGNIPNWIWEDGNGGLSYVNLSHNRLTGLEEPYNFRDLYVLDLHSNYLTGVFPILPQTAAFIDYSNNLFNSSLPESIGRNLWFAYVFSVSNNALNGVIPQTICNAPYLTILDLSNNQLNGSIPQCLIESGTSLGVLNLGNNSLRCQIEGTLPCMCGLNTLDLHGNLLEGKIPESLVNCTMLELHGSVVCGQNHQNKWPKLQILDIAHNSFSGTVPPDFFGQWGAMMTDENGQSNKLIRFSVLKLSEFYYQDSVTLTVKGLELELVKILTLFTSIDISSNHFSGEIPSTIGQLKALYLLNIPHNEFTGSIPPSIRNLIRLESLDMSLPTE